MTLRSPFKGLPIINQQTDVLIPNYAEDQEQELAASAVLLVVHKIDNQWHILLTQRASHLKHHAGQISFPGGRFDDKDLHLLNTALRETREEVGIDEKHLRVIGHLPHRPTLTGFRIHPFVAMVESLPKLSISVDEVSDVFSAPLDFLCDPHNQLSESIFYQGKQRKYYKIPWQQRMIWGATARMLVDLSPYYQC